MNFSLFNNLEPEKRAMLLDKFELFLIAAMIFLLGVFHQWLNPYLQFDRSDILVGQWWRLLTCNLVHLSVPHMLLNLAGFILAVVLFKENIPTKYWYANIVLCFLSVGFGILVFDTAVENYVGLSGALYGVLAFGLILNIKRQPLISLAVWAFMLHRVYLQYQSDFDPSSMSDFIGGNVIASSHLLGLICGHLMAFFVILEKKMSVSKA